MSFSRPALHSQTFCARCKKEPKIKADNNGNKVTAEYLALRLSALWGRACSDVHPDVNAHIWAQMNVNRVVPLERWLTDATDLLLVCAQPSPPPCSSVPNVRSGSSHVNWKFARQFRLSTPAPPRTRYHLLDVNSYPVQRPRVITSTPAEA